MERPAYLRVVDDAYIQEMREKRRNEVRVILSLNQGRSDGLQVLDDADDGEFTVVTGENGAYRATAGEITEMVERALRKAARAKRKPAERSGAYRKRPAG